MWQGLQTLVRPVLEYVSFVWDSYAIGAQAKYLEDVQRSAAHMVNNVSRTHHVTSTATLIQELE